MVNSGFHGEFIFFNEVEMTIRFFFDVKSTRGVQIMMVNSKGNP